VTHSSFKNIKALSSEILRRFGGHLDGVGTLRARWHALVGEPMAGHSEPTLYEGGRLTVTVRSPAWASRLRQQEPGLMRTLRADASFRGVRELRIRIQPTDPIVKPTPVPTSSPSRISPAAARMVKSVAATVSDVDLRAALERLAGAHDVSKP
jgi:hypothetical protein